MSLGPLPNIVPPLLYRAPARGGALQEGRRLLSSAHSMVLGERLAVMNSIHQSESYTALLSFSVKFCLGGRAGPVLSPRYVPGWPEPSAPAFLRTHVTDALTPCPRGP